MFRGQIHSDQYGEAFVTFVADNAKAKLGADPQNVKVAIIHEDGPYGVGVADATERFGKQRGLQLIMREGYSATAPIFIARHQAQTSRRGCDFALRIQSRHHAVLATSTRERLAFQNAGRQWRRL